MVEVFIVTALLFCILCWILLGVIFTEKIYHNIWSEVTGTIVSLAFFLVWCASPLAVFNEFFFR